MIIATVIIFLALLALLILAHELGHFIAARRSGIRVDEFGLGFPPKAVSFKRKNTVFSLNWIPLGGFVKIYGEEGEGAGDPDSFVSKSVLTRIIVVLAGVAMNFLLAVAVLSFGLWYGLPGSAENGDGAYVRDVRVSIVGVAPGSPADLAGIKVGDAVRELAAGEARQAVSEVENIQNFISQNKGQEMSIFIKRGDEVIEKEAVPRLEAPAGEGALGVLLEKTGIVSYPWYRAPWEGAKATVRLTIVFLSAFYHVIADLTVRGVMTTEIAGPVGIGALTYQFTQLGFSYLINFAAILSINLAIINALPFPALDGGRFVFLLIEAVKGSPVNQRFEKTVHTVGFAVLIFLMILVTARDVMKLF